VRIKVDEDLPRAVTVLLVTTGYTDTKSVVDQRMGGWDDLALWEAVQQEGRVARTPSNPNCKLVLWTWGVFDLEAVVTDKNGRAHRLIHPLGYDDDVAMKGAAFVMA